MRVALFTDTYPPQLNGVATATYTLEKILKQKGHEVLVVTTGLIGQRKTSVEDGLVRIPGITMKRMYNYQLSRFFSKKGTKAIEEFKPDVIHVQTEMSIGLFGRLLAKKFHIPVVYTYHTLYEDYTYYITQGLKPIDNIAKSAVANLSKFLSDKATEFTTTSEKARDILLKYGVTNYINVVPIGIDFHMFEKENVDFNKVKEISDKYELDNKFTLLILGRIAKEKSNDFIIDGLNKFLQKHSELREKVRLLVVGDGPDRPNLIKQSENLKMDDVITFVGAVSHDEVPCYYYASNLFISASVSETQGLTFNEAMACNTLVLAKYDKNLVECIIDNKTGFFYKDEEEFEQKLLYILNISDEERKLINKNAYENNVSKYSLDLFYRRMINVYYKAIKKYW